MASSLRGSQTICGAFSKAASPRYVCHSCRQNLLRPRGQQLRAASTSLSSGRARRSQGLSELQSCPRASYATKSFVDYIHPEKEQRVQGFLEGNPEDEVIYEEATTWVGIESVGQERHLGDRQPSADAFKPFMQQSSSQKVDRDYFLMHLYSAIVDVLVNRTLGKELTDLYTTSPDVRAREVAASLGLSVTQSGTLAGLQADSLTLEQAMKDETHKSGMTGLEIEELMAKLKLNFSDPTTFEILKYFSFISRHRVPDPILSNVWNNDKPLTAFVDLLTRHYVQTAPKTVASTLKSRQEKALLAAKSGDPMDANSENGVKQTGKLAPLGPNVMVLPRRETPVDKQKEVGRWKIIEKELTARGLPVLGRHAPRKPQKQVEA